MKENNSITKLSLCKANNNIIDGNQIGYEGVKTISESLKNNMSLTELYMGIIE